MKLSLEVRTAAISAVNLAGIEDNSERKREQEEEAMSMTLRDSKNQVATQERGRSLPPRRRCRCSLGTSKKMRKNGEERWTIEVKKREFDLGGKESDVDGEA